VLSYLLVAVIGLFFINRTLSFPLILPSFNEVVFQVRYGWDIFLSQVAINLYTSSNVLILGFLTNNTYVGYYSAAQKIVMIVLNIISLVQQTFYPYANRLVYQSKEVAFRFFKKLTYVMLIAGTFLSFLLFVTAPVLVSIILGNGYNASIPVVRILSILPLVVGLSNIWGILLMLPLGYKKEFMKIIWGASLINIVLAFLLVPFLKHVGTAISALVAEIYVTLAMFLFFQQKTVKLLQS
jgi:PST family polysaccharide transporter